jgi:hypothetical protein
VALYLRGWAGMIRGSALLREGREPEAARQAAAAEESFRAAAEGGIAQAAFLGARMHLSGGWADLPGFRQEPRSALAMLEAVQARAPRARALLVEIYEGSERYRHLDGLRSPARARELKEQAAHRERG